MGFRAEMVGGLMCATAGFFGGMHGFQDSLNAVDRNYPCHETPAVAKAGGCETLQGQSIADNNGLEKALRRSHILEAGGAVLMVVGIGAMGMALQENWIEDQEAVDGMRASGMIK